MPNFPARDLTNQYISRSYQDVVQQYVPGGLVNYLLDGYGNEILSISASSFGNSLVITQNDTASWAYNSISSSFANLSTLALVADVALLADTAISASIADTASFALNGGGSGTTLFTGSTYPITASWAITASFALNASAGSGTTLVTGSTYPITASWAQTSSWAINAINGGTTLTTGSTYPITSSWTNNVITASFAVNAGIASTASFASSVITSSFAINAGTAATASYANTFTRELTTGSTYQITSSWSTNSNSSSITSTNLSSSYYLIFSTGSSGIQPLYASSSLTYNPFFNQISGSSLGITASLFGTASQSVSSSYAVTSSNTLTASWAITSSFAQTASVSFFNFVNVQILNTTQSIFATQSLISTQSLFSSQSVFATSSLSSISSSWATASYTSSFLTPGTYQVTSSWSVNSTSESLTPNNLSSSFYLTFVTASTGIQPLYASSSLTYNPFFNQISGSALGITASLFGSSSFSLNSGLASTASSVNTASYANNAGTASFAIISISSSFTPVQNFIQSSNGLTSVIANNNAVTTSVDNIWSTTEISNSVPTKWEGSTSLAVNGFITTSNVTNGYPVSFDWGTGLNGSYFSTWTPTTYVSEMLRFFAGAFSSSFPLPTPNTRTYSSITTNQNSAGSTVTINGRVPQNTTNSNLIYLNSKGWVPIGGQVFSGFTFKNGSTFNTTYDSVAGGSTIVSSSIGAQAFGLGPLLNSNLQTFFVSASVTDNFFSASASISNYTTSSQYLLNQPSQVTVGSGLQLAKIPSANSAVIPSAYQDGKYTGVTGSGLFYNAGSNDLTNISSSGQYQVTASVGIASGSSPYTFLNATSVAYFYTPIGDNTFSNNTNSVVTVSSSSVSVTSRSLSGAPYLTTGSTWNYTATGSGMFSPLYNNGNLATESIGVNFVGASTSQPTSASVSAATGLINSTGTIFDSTTTTVRATGTIPFQSDTVAFSTYLTASGIGTNIIQTGVTASILTMSLIAFDRGNATNTINSASIQYHVPGTFGQPSNSGSLAYYGRPQGFSVSTDVGTSETFVDEAQRIILNDACLSFTGSFFTSSNALAGNDLQVKPGFLDNPSGSFRYWYPSGFGSNIYKYYVRHFKRTTTINNLVIDPGVTLVNWDDTTSNKLTIVLLFESAKVGIFGNCRLYDINKLAGSVNNNVGNGFQNPFSQSVDIYFNGTGNTVGTVITVPVVNANGMTLDGTSANDEFYLIVRYNGDPTPITNINVTSS